MVNVHRRQLLEALSVLAGQGPGDPMRLVPGTQLAASPNGTARQGILDVRAYGAKGDGENDDTPAFEKALGAASGRAVHVPPGRYRVGLRLRGDTHLFGDGTLVYGAAAPALRYEPKFGEAARVDGIGERHDYPDGLPQTVSALKCRAGDIKAGGIRAGDIALLYSSDPYSFSDNKKNFIYKGELFRVLAADSDRGEVLVHGRLRDRYPSEPRLRRLPRHRIAIEGLTFEGYGNPFSQSVVRRARGALWLTGAVYPRIRQCHFRRTWWSGLIAEQCWGGDFDVSFEELPDLPKANAYGYGVALFGASQACSVRIVGSKCRHGYTTGGLRRKTFEDRHHRGSGLPAANVVHDSIVAHSSGAAFDTHFCFDQSFVGCLALRSRMDKGVTARNGQGFQNRGNGTVFQNCTAIDCNAGFHDFTSRYAWEQPQTARYIGCVVANGPPKARGWHVGGNADHAGRSHVALSNCAVSNLETALTLAPGCGATVQGCHAEGLNGPLAVLRRGSDLTVAASVVDLRRSGAVSNPVIRADERGARVVSNGLTVLAPATGKTVSLFGAKTSGDLHVTSISTLLSGNIEDVSAGQSPRVTLSDKTK